MKFKTLNRIILSLLLVGAFFSAFNYVSPWLIIGFVFGYLSFVLIVSTNVQLDFFVKAFHHNPFEEDGRIALTFDDGPVENTLKILEVLDKYQVKASFFCIGKNIEKNPEIFKLILEKGHFIGNHTWSHTRKMGFISTDKMTLFKNEFKNLRVLFNILPNTKKARLDLIFIQNLQDFQGVFYGAVVKCEGDPAIFLKRIVVKSFHEKIQLHIG